MQVLVSVVFALSNIICRFHKKLKKLLRMFFHLSSTNKLLEKLVLVNFSPTSSLSQFGLKERASSNSLTVR